MRPARRTRRAVLRAARRSPLAALRPVRRTARATLRPFRRVWRLARRATLLALGIMHLLSSVLIFSRTPTYHVGRVREYWTLVLLAARRHRRCKTVEGFSMTDTLPDNCAVYNPPTNCWFILFSESRFQWRLQSSRLVAISKSTGEIVYDGSANDEG
jgi:hypothetical protein